MTKSPQKRPARKLDHPCYLLRLAELELVDRKWRIVERRIRARPSVRRPCKLAGLRFPAVKSFDTSDFAAIPSLNQPLVLWRGSRICRRP
jgi:hypothetical protein